MPRYRVRVVHILRRSDILEVEAENQYEAEIASLQEGKGDTIHKGSVILTNRYVDSTFNQD